MSNASLELGGGNWAAKDGNLLGYAVGDTSGKYLPREFDFSRGADIAATRVNKDGLIEKYRENLLTYSNQFDTTWYVADATATSGQTGYDGTSDAWLFTTTVAGASLEKSITASGVVVFSMYAKKGTVDGIRLRIDAATDANAYFNLSNNSVHSFTGSAIDASITDLGGGWHRCEVSANISSPVKVAVYTTDGTTAYDNGNIYIQDAQLERGLVATDYLESDDETGKAGVLDNLPRIDYTSGSAQLLMEPSRTNYLPHSEYLEEWQNLSGATLTPNAATAPDGTTTATSWDSPTFAYRILRTVPQTLSASTNYVFSFYAKNIDADGAAYRVYNNTAASDVVAATSYISEINTSDWTRIEVQFTTGATPTDAYTCYVGSVGFSGEILFWGAQLEEGSFATSYIPNYGTALGVTRNADTCSKTGVSSLIGQAEGTIFIETDLSDVEDTVFRGIAELNDGGTLNRITIFRNNNGTIRLYVRESGSVQMDSTYSTSVSGTTKIAVAYKTNDIAFYVNGNQVALDTSATIPSCSDVDLGVIESNSSKTLNDRINQALIFTTRLSNTELAAITTL